MDVATLSKTKSLSTEKSERRNAVYTQALLLSPLLKRTEHGLDWIQRLAMTTYILECLLFISLYRAENAGSLESSSLPKGRRLSGKLFTIVFDR